MTVSALIFFVLFAVTLFATYIAIRRELAPTGFVALVGAVAAIMFMIMFSLGQGNAFPQALVAGALTGSIFIVMTVMIARFFRSSEARARSQE